MAEVIVTAQGCRRLGVCIFEDCGVRLAGLVPLLPPLVVPVALCLLNEHGRFALRIRSLVETDVGQHVRLVPMASVESLTGIRNRDLSDEMLSRLCWHRQSDQQFPIVLRRPGEDPFFELDVAFSPGVLPLPLVRKADQFSDRPAGGLVDGRPDGVVTLEDLELEACAHPLRDRVADAPPLGEPFRLLGVLPGLLVRLRLGEGKLLE